MKSRRKRSGEAPRREPKPDTSRTPHWWETSRARYGIPLFVIAASLGLGVWTFDSKLSLSGDNAEYIVLARSLAQGEGLAYLHSPEPGPATKFPFGFPLLLAPLAWAFPDDWVPMKALVLALFALGMGVLYQLARERVGVWPGLAVVALSLLAGKSYLTEGAAGDTHGPTLLHYAHQVMSEVPYLTFSLLALWLVDLGVGREGLRGNWRFLGGMACAIWACCIRTSGIALVAAVAAHLLLRRDFRRCLVFVGATFLCLLPWTLRNQAVGGGGVYLKQLFMVNPYYPEQGWLDLPGFLERFIGHSDRYLRGWAETLVPSLSGTDTILHPAPLLLLVLATAATVLCLRRGEQLLLLYAAFSMGMLLLWFWPSDRFLVPILPVVLLLGVWTVVQIQDRLAAYGRAERYAARLVVWGCLVAWFIAHAGGAKRLADYADGDYPPNWQRYYDAGKWLEANAPVEAVVLCRKGFWMHVVSGRRTTGFPYDEPAAVLAHMERAGVDYVVVESLGFRQTADYLGPAIGEYADRFRVAWYNHAEATYVLQFLPPTP